MGESREYPVVMRMQGLWPQNIGGFGKHRKREGGDLGHVDPVLSKKNRRLLGEANWAQLAHQEIRRMKLENHEKELAKLEKRRRTTELQRRLAEGPKDPWRATRHGPMREVVLTAHADWFKVRDGDPFDQSYQTREAQFQELAVGWLKKTFGDDCVHARADRDEKTFHVHAVILPREVTKDGRKMLQPSKHDVSRYYEKGQDDVGAWFSAAGIGLMRGEQRKKKLRDAIEHNAELRKKQKKGERLDESEKPLPEYRQHVSPRKWREAQECKLVEREVEADAREERLAEREMALTAREQAASDKQHEAEEVLEVAQAVAEGDLSGLSDEAQGGVEETVEVSAKPSFARRLFGEAIARLRQDEQASARAELQEAFEEVREADETIVQIAQLLPMGLRKKVASARKSLTRSLMLLTKHIPGDRGTVLDDIQEE